jgi:acyl-CoA thioesterase FadM
MSDDPRIGRSPFRVRFDECGPDGLLRTSVALRYAQDLASHHSTLLGFDRTWYRQRGLVWLVRAAEVALLAPVRFGDALDGTTRVVGSRRVWARRRTDFHAPGGRLVAWVQIDWVLLDAQGGPTRIPPEFDVAFAWPAARLALARVALGEPPAATFIFAFGVRPQELDPMEHANNAVYADWLDERIIGSGDEPAVRAIPRLARLEYARSAERDGTVRALAWPDADGPAWSVRLFDDAGDLLRARLEPGAGGE